MLRVFLGHSTANVGCAGVSVSQDVTDPESVTITDIDLSATPPEIIFDDVDPIGGLDVVTALRSPGVADHQIEPDKHSPND